MNDGETHFTNIHFYNSDNSKPHSKAPALGQISFK